MPRTNNIAAYTACNPDAPANYPEYISINTDDGSDIEITVRSPAKDGKCGTTSNIVLPPAALRQIAVKLYTYSMTTRA